MPILRVFTSLLFLLFAFTSIAQKGPMKWGKVPKADLEMTTYELDPEAEAVVLGEYGTIQFSYDPDGGVSYEFYYHRRVKILKESAVDRGDISIGYDREKGAEKIRNLKAQVFFPDGKKEQLKKKAFFEEKVDKAWTRKKFAFPNLKPGCVIEYKYTKVCEHILTLEDWYFQEDIPVRMSELSVDIPEIYQYVYLIESGGRKIEESIDKGVLGGSGTASFKVNRVGFKLTNLEAMKEESYVTTMRDYLASVRFQLQSYKTRFGEETVISNWEKLAKELEDNSKFGKLYSKPSKYTKLAAAAAPHIDPSASELDKVKQAQKFITSQVKWNEDYGILCDEKLDDLFAKKIADGGEINMMLLALLKSQGIKAYPMLSSTRRHGKIIQLYPIVQQFNHVMVYAEVDGKAMVLDALDEFHPAGYPHSNALNHFGLVLDGKSSKWADIKTKSSTKSILASMELDAEGNLKGMINSGMNGYHAVFNRQRFDDAPKYGGWKEELEETYPETKIDSFETINLKDIDASLKVNVGCTISKAAQVNGDFIYFSPVILPAYNENPFKLEKRNYPVDLVHPWKENYILNLTIPEGYVLEELPEPVLLTLPEDGGRFNYQVKKVDDTHIQLVSKVSIKQLYYGRESYFAIKKFVDLIVEKQGEQIVLKKKS